MIYINAESLNSCFNDNFSPTHMLHQELAKPEGEGGGGGGGEKKEIKSLKTPGTYHRKQWRLNCGQHAAKFEENYLKSLQINASAGAERTHCPGKGCEWL